MSSFRNNSSSNSKDPVQQIVDRLKEKLHNKSTTSSSLSKSNINFNDINTVITQTQEEFRIMKIHHRIGTFGKQDNDISRAIVLFEYIAREQKGYKLSMKLLSTIACLKEQNFIKYHSMIGNFRCSNNNKKKSNTNNTTNNTSTQILKKKSTTTITTATPTATATATTTTNTKRRMTTRRNTTMLRESTIPKLAIKLGILLEDPNGFAIHAQQLFNDIQQYAKTMLGGGDKSRQQLYDIQRYQSAYEAVCLYIITKTNQKTNSTRRRKRIKTTRKKITTTTKRRRRTTTQQQSEENNYNDLNDNDNNNNNNNEKSDNDDDNDDEEEEENDNNGTSILEVDHIMDASNDFPLSVFKFVLKHTENLISEMKMNGYHIQSQNNNKSSSIDVIKKTNNNEVERGCGSTTTTATTKKRNVSSKNDNRNTIIINDDDTVNNNNNNNKQQQEEDEIIVSTNNNILNFPPNIVECKRKILFHSRKIGKEIIHNETGEVITTISNTRALTQVADDILKRNGLL